MPQLRCTDTAVDAIKAVALRSAEAYAEIAMTLSAVRQFGLGGEESVAVLNHRWDVYLLESANSALAAVLVVEPAAPDVIVVADVGPYSDASDAHKRLAATRAAVALRIIPTDVHVVRR